MITKTEHLRLEKLIEATRSKIFALAESIYPNVENPEEQECRHIKLNLLYWIQQSLAKKQAYELHDNLVQIHKTLKLYASLENDLRNPFEKFMTPEEKKQPENIEMLEQYNDSYRNIFLPYFKNEIKESLLAPKITKRMQDFASIKANLENARNVHNNPEIYLESDFRNVTSFFTSKARTHYTITQAPVRDGLLNSAGNNNSTRARI